MSKQLNQNVETNDELVRVNQDYRKATELYWEEGKKTAKLEERITELESLLSQMKGPMESIWIPVATMELLRELAIKKNVSANDLAHDMIDCGMNAECIREFEERRNRKEKVTP